MGGVPLIYASQEVGQSQNVPFFSNQPINWAQNPETLNNYKHVLSVYNDLDGIKAEEIIDHSSQDVVAFSRSINDKELLFLANIREDSIEYTLPGNFINSSWDDILTNQSLALDSTIYLAGFTYYLLEQR
jgi:hypothetical protein